MVVNLHVHVAKRKCDQEEDNNQENDSNHIHQCQNGHQIRGINGILISNSIPSLYTCEEILDGCMLKTLETNLQKLGKRSKRHIQIGISKIQMKNKDNVDKWKHVWNIGLGKLVCSYLENQLNHKITFQQKSEFENQASNIHYIFILDDSGSMQGTKWETAKVELYSVQSNQKTLIWQKLVSGRMLKPNFKEFNNKINYKGGGTNFEHPFQQALQLIQKYTCFNKIQILFYTDGEAGYPNDIINQFCQLPQGIRSQINLTVCSGENLPIHQTQQHRDSNKICNKQSQEILYSQLIFKEFGQKL